MKSSQKFCRQQGLCCRQTQALIIGLGGLYLRFTYRSSSHHNTLHICSLNVININSLLFYVFCHKNKFMEKETEFLESREE